MGGVARRATLIKQERQTSDHVLVLDAGNSLTGDRNPARRTKGQSSIQAMNRLGYDALALGGMDLQLGPEVLRQRIAEAMFPVLSANAVDMTTDSRLTDPYTVIELDHHQVAIVGITGLSPSSVIQVRDPFETAKATVAELVDQADVIIVLSNAGQAINEAIATQIPGIDVVIGAAGEITPQPVKGEGGLLLQADRSSPGHAGRVVGVADLEFDSQGKLAEITWERVRLSPEIADDPDLLNWVAQQR